MGCIPSSGDHFIWNGSGLKWVDMDLRRVDKVLVSLVPSNPEDQKPHDVPLFDQLLSAN